MGLMEDLRQLAEQVRRRLEHIKSEEATKQALVLPLFQVLGYDVYDPTEVRPEYVADFAKKRPGGGMEKVDYVLNVGGAPGIFVECKPAGTPPEDHDGQLARYFNATPSIRVGVITNGVRYRFFTDLQSPNVMDARPFFEFDILHFSERDVENLRIFSRESFNAAAVQNAAEEIIYTDRLTSVVNDVLRNPSENFVRFLLGELDLVPGRVTAKVVERFTPIVRRAIQGTLLEMMTRSLQQEIAAPAIVAPTPAAPAVVPPVTAAPAASEGEGRVVTTAEELELFAIVQRICATSPHSVPIAYKDTGSYFGINLGKVTQWFIRGFCTPPKMALVTRVPLEQARALAPGFEIDAPSEAMGASRVYFSAPSDVERMRPLVLAAFEDALRRRSGGAED